MLNELKTADIKIAKTFLICTISFLLITCSSDDDDDAPATSNITLTANSAFLGTGSSNPSGYYALGCFLVSSTVTACLCVSEGSIVTDADNPTGFCDLEDDSVTLVNVDDVIANVQAGTHGWCKAFPSAGANSSECGDGGSGEIEVPASGGDFVVSFGSEGAGATIDNLE